MMEEKDLIRIRWHVDRTQDPVVYMLVCQHPDHPDLQVSVGYEPYRDNARGITGRHPFDG